MYTCEICKFSTDNIKKFTNHLRTHKLSVKEYYDTYLLKDNENKCNYCGKPTKFKSLKFGYYHYCSQTCSSSDSIVQEKHKKTCKERYNVEWFSQSSSWHKKINMIYQERYNTDYGIQADEIKEKIKNTMYKKYGVLSYLQTEDCKTKAKQTCLEKYGKEHYTQTEEYYLLRLKKSNDEHNCHWWNNIEKIKETNIKRYGSNFASETNKIKEKILKTRYERYGKYNLFFKYYYNNQYFDSSWELAYYIWLTDNNINFIYHPNIRFKYEFNNTTYTYEPDFIVNGKIIELKGPYLMKLMLIENTKENEKYKCILKNNIKIITDCTEYLNYIKQKYGKNYLKQYKI